MARRIIYVLFLREQHEFNVHETTTITVIYNIGAIIGGWTFGLWSQTLGRRRTIMIAADAVTSRSSTCGRFRQPWSRSPAARS